jgi:hypothetical protein
VSTVSVTADATPSFLHVWAQLGTIVEHKQESRAARYGERGGQAKGPPLSINFHGNFRSKNFCSNCKYGNTEVIHPAGLACHDDPLLTKWAGGITQYIAVQNTNLSAFGRPKGRDILGGGGVQHKIH